MIEDKTFYVEYESLDNICFSCGFYGHKEDGCLPSHPPEPVVAPSAKADVEAINR
ncbi:hypothetical protein LINPERHAP1_LOCUS17936 [Linum perenne]